MNTREKIQICWSIEKMFWDDEYDHFHWLFYTHMQLLNNLAYHLKVEIYNIMDGYDEWE